MKLGKMHLKILDSVFCTCMYLCFKQALDLFSTLKVDLNKRVMHSEDLLLI